MLAKHILPIDNDSIVRNFLENAISNQDIIILDSVSDECRYVSQGIIHQELPIIQDSQNITNTSNIILTVRSHNLLDNNFCYGVQQSRLDANEFRNRKGAYLDSADGKIISYLLHPDDVNEEFIVITEESSSNNDGKVFKKIPLICAELGVDTVPIINYLTEFNDLTIKLDSV